MKTLGKCIQIGGKSSRLNGSSFWYDKVPVQSFKCHGWEMTCRLRTAFLFRWIIFIFLGFYFIFLATISTCFYYLKGKLFKLSERILSSVLMDWLLIAVRRVNVKELNQVSRALHHGFNLKASGLVFLSPPTCRGYQLDFVRIRKLDYNILNSSCFLEKISYGFPSTGYKSFIFKDWTSKWG